MVTPDGAPFGSRAHDVPRWAIRVYDSLTSGLVGVHLAVAC